MRVAVPCRAAIAIMRIMNKTIIIAMMTVGSALGGIIPWLLGDQDMLSGWVFVGSFIGGIVGIWLGVKLSRALR